MDELEYVDLITDPDTVASQCVLRRSGTDGKASYAPFSVTGMALRDCVMFSLLPGELGD